MVWLRKGFVWLLSLVLLFALIDGVVAASLDLNFGTPTRLESLLNGSGLYNSFVSTAIQQANITAGGNSGSSNGVSLSDAAVQQAAEATFTPSIIQNDVDIVINSNYAWLEGKTATPAFSIDLTSAKQNFAQQVGQYVETHVNGLPVCSVAQAISEEQTTDPLQLSCRPPNISSAALGAQVSQQLASNSGFLNNTVITANSINPNKGSQSKPYYQQLTQAPRLYRLAKTIPWLLMGLALLCILGIIFISPVRRRGIRKISFVFLEVGILLVVVKFAVDKVFTKIENRIFNQASVGPLQRTLMNVIEHIVHSINLDNLYFGIAFIVIAIAIFVYLIITHNKQKNTTLKDNAHPTIDSPTNASDKEAAPDSSGPNKQEIPPNFSSRSRPKRSKLIQ